VADVSRSGAVVPASFPIRILEVLGVLRRHGFLRIRSRPAPEQVRAAFDDLGPVFQKFGQVLALRRDLLPDDYVRELEALHDRTRPLPVETVREVVERELGPLQDRFATFDPEPLAAATIAQVHSAHLADGRHVVVKVRRPDLEATIERDTAILRRLARALEWAVPALRPVDLPAVVREFREALRREADFRLEASAIRRFRESLSDVPRVWIPDVVDELSTAAVLTMEHSPGLRIDRYAAEHPDEAPELARAVGALVLRQIFENGLFHADPHPGNLFVLPDGRLCLHDFGMTGELDERLRTGLGDLLAAEVRGDAEAAADAYLRVGLPGGDTDRNALVREFDRLLATMHARPLSEISLGDELQKLLRVGGRNRIRNPRELLLLARALLIAEALLRRLDPDVNVIDVFREQLGRLQRQRLDPRSLLEGGVDFARSLEELSRDLPMNLERIVRRFASGELGRVRDEGLIREVGRLRGAVRSLVAAVAGSSLIVAGVLLIASGDGRLTGLGLVGAAAGALMLIFALILAWKNDQQGG
jgi:ubiquinone biosynthesis protein